MDIPSTSWLQETLDACTMDIPSTSWLPEPKMEEPYNFASRHQQTCLYYSDSRNSFSSDSLNDYTNINLVNKSIHATTAINENEGEHQHYKVMKTGCFAPTHGSSSNTFTTISFGNVASPPQNNPHHHLGGFKRNRRQAQEHVFAERKRREKLSHHFISLYSLLPQLKKMDKATVLEDASNYIKELQNRVKELEESIQGKGKHIIQSSTVPVWRSKPCGDLGVEDHASSSKTSQTSSTNDPEIFVRISGTSILVRIYCQQNIPLVMKALTEMERLHLVVISSNVLPFSKTSFLVTMTAQISGELLMTAMDLVKCLQSALSNFI